LIVVVKEPLIQPKASNPGPFKRAVSLLAFRSAINWSRSCLP